jgi:hypothetical protein
MSVKTDISNAKAPNVSPIPMVLTSGSGNPQSSALNTTLQNSNAQNALNKSLSGGLRKKYNTYKGGDIKVPTVVTPVKPLVSTQSPQSNVTALTSLNAQVKTNATFDSLAQTPKPVGGGMYKKRGGYVTKNNWGCLSGGYKRKRKYKTKKHKTKKHKTQKHKHKKTKKNM